MQPTPSGQFPSGKKRKTALGARAGAAAHTLPMTGVTMPQALLLLHCLYAFDRRAWVVGVGFQDLCDLVRVCDKFACCGVLQLVDKTLLERAEAGEGDAGDEASMLNVANAPAHHKLASRYRLSAYEAHVARFLGLNADRVDLAALDPSLAHALRGPTRCAPSCLPACFPLPDTWWPLAVPCWQLCQHVKERRQGMKDVCIAAFVGKCVYFSAAACMAETNLVWQIGNA